MAMGRGMRKMAPRTYVSQRGKTSRAFRAYVDLLNAAEWLRDRMIRQLDTFELSMMEFWVLETLYSEGPQYPQALSRKFRCSRQNVGFVIKRLQERKLVSREEANLEVTTSEHWVNPTGTASKGRPEKGRKIILVRLTPEGQEVIAFVYPKHLKVVKSEMRVLEGREQQTLSRLCRKLRKGDVLKFVREMTMEDLEEEEISG